MGDFKQLTVWRKAHAAALATYRLTNRFPVAERFGLVAQMRRASASVSANIAESRGRYSEPDQRRFLQIALGSARELECHLLLARDLGLVAARDFDMLAALIDEVQRMLAALTHRGRLVSGLRPQASGLPR